MFRTFIAAAIAVAILPLAAGADSRSYAGHRADLRYCAQLSDLYARYVGSYDTAPRKQVKRFDVEGRVAIAKCQEGDAEAAIPILERKLVNAKVGLPQRD